MAKRRDIENSFVSIRQPSDISKPQRSVIGRLRAGMSRFAGSVGDMAYAIFGECGMSDEKLSRHLTHTNDLVETFASIFEISEHGWQVSLSPSHDMSLNASRFITKSGIGSI